MIPHILFADDDEDTCAMMEMTLRHAGFRVSVTGRSSEILHLCSVQQFDALVLDNWMPETSGLEICKQIRALDNSTPILVCSGAATEADIAAAIAAGAQGYIEKPFDPDYLIQVLQSAIANEPLQHREAKNRTPSPTQGNRRGHRHTLKPL
jgi:DNA-binding response OmpR family regulator